MLLKDQEFIGYKTPMPVDIVNDATAVTSVTGETIQFVVASTNVNDAGSAAGTVIYARTAYAGILDSAGIGLGNKADTSFAFVTGTVLTTQVEFPNSVLEQNQDASRATKLAAIGALLANGEFVIDHRTGLIVGKKAAVGTSDTANYKYRAATVATTIAGTVTVDSEFPAAAAAADNFANPTTTSVMAMGMLWDGATWDRMKGDSTDGVLVNLGTNNDVTVTGSVTANAGTNLNTSLLALEAGGNLAAAATSLAVMDDWDETDRAKVNLIVGQAGIAAGTGVDGVTVPRVTLATDVPLPAGTNAIGKLAANSGVDIGDVDVLTIGGQTPTFGAGAVAAGTQRVTHASDDPAVTSLGVMDDWDNGASDGASVSGDVAHDSVDAGEPVKIGMKAYAFDGTAAQTAVAEADRVNAISDLQGIQYVQTAHPAFFHVSADYASAQTNASVKAAPGSGSIYITDIFISNGATAGNVTLLDGSGGTVLFECYPGINGGAVFNPKNPIKLTATTALCITSTTVTTHSVTVCGFIA